MRIGIFDSGYGGLTILDSIRKRLPGYDYVYLGDNARAPYGTRSFEVIYRYTWQAVRYLFEQDCALIILACNTASAKALRTIQQHDLPEVWARDNGQMRTQNLRRVLGVIRPTVESVPAQTSSGHVGILGTPGTISSDSYPIELHKVCPDLTVVQQACPMWVPLIESGEHRNDGADWFVAKYLNELLARDPQIDTIVLGCTHYPLLLPKIQRQLAGLPIRLVCQGDIVADRLADYLQRHADLRGVLSQGGQCRYLTTEDADKFRQSASVFLSELIDVTRVEL
ncbi:MAG: aspartate/glutamate racemase family protein [Paludibacteraceae bacterium]|nr:aspartate/glutamate racemase family protein [Paludibacteraceae bacterium]